MRTGFSLCAALAVVFFGSSNAAAQCNLTTLFTGGNGLGVNSVCYFDLDAVSPILVTGLDVNTTTAVGTPVVVELYRRSGTYVGNTASNVGWSLIGTATGTAAAQFSPTITTFGSPVLFSSGVSGLCVRYVNLANRYTNGNGANQAYSNALYSLTLGQSAAAAFTGTPVNNRVWNGTIRCSSALGLYPDFTATPTSGPSPRNVQFADTTFTSDPGGVTSWAWDLDGDAIIDSNAQNPTFVYTSCGRYSVSLTVTDAVHPQASITKSQFLEIDPPLLVTASFTVTPSEGQTPLSVTFTDTSTGSPTAWAWDLDGDNIIDSNAPNPTITYTIGGKYNVTLTASNACGSSTVTVNGAVACVDNDECTTAFPVVAGVNGPFRNDGATNSFFWTCGSTSSITRDVWFSYTPSCNVLAEVNTCSTAGVFDTQISVHSGVCGALAELGCNDDAANCGSISTLSRLTGIAMTGGRTYFIAVAGWNGGVGSFSLEIVTTPTGAGAFTTVSPGCGGTGLTAAGNPNIGGSVNYTMGPVQGLPFINLGIIPLGIPICAGGCVLGATLDATYPGASFGGPIPCDPLLISATVYAQGLDLGAAGGCAANDPLLLTLSDTIRTVIG